MRRTVVSLMVILVLLLSCSSDKSTDPPEEPPASGYDLVTTTTIGATGGAIDDGTVSIEVPANALSQSTDLSLYVSSTAKPFGDQGVSSTYRLEGLPEDYDDNLHVKIRYSGPLNEESFIAIGEKTYDPEVDDSVETYSLIDATDSSGFLVADIGIDAGDASHSGSFGKRSNSANLIRYLLGASDMQTYQTTWFKISYPKILRENVIQMNSFMEDALNELEKLYFYQHQITEVLPFRVVVREKVSHNFARFIPRENYRYYTRPSHTTIEVNELDIGTTRYADLRISVAHEIYLLEAAMRNRVGADLQPLCWFDYASARWFEGLFSAGNQYVPTGHYLECTEVLDTFDIPAYMGESGQYEHGMAMAPFIKFLVERYGERVLRYIDDERREHNTKDIRNLLFGSYVTLIRDEPYTGWYPGFVREFVNEDLYSKNGQITTKVLDDEYHEQMITSDDNQTGAIPLNYRDLESRVIKLGLANPQFEDGDQLMLSVQSDVLAAENMHLIVFKRNGDDVVYIGDGVRVTVDNIYDIEQAGYDIYCVIVKCKVNLQNYNEQHEIRLLFNVVEPPDMNIVRTVITVVVDATFHDSDQDQHTTEDYHVAWEAEGSTTGNVFTGDIDMFVYGNYPIGTMSITLDPQTSAVIEFDASATIDDQYYGFSNWNIAGTGVPVTYSGDYVQCGIEGVSACTPISGLNERWERDAVWNEILYHDCSASSWIYITLYPEEYFK